MYALVDCNNFFVSCEKVFRPELNGKPVIVLSNNDGCAVSRSQEVKDLGIPMASPFFKHKKILELNKTQVFSANFSLYGNLSQRVMACLRHINGPIEVYSIDEAFLDISHIPETKQIHYAKEIVEAIYQWTGIPISIGIGKTKTLAKIANHIAKKDPDYKNVCHINNKNKDTLLKKVDVIDIWGIGYQFAKKLKAAGIHTAHDLQKKSLSEIKKILHVNGVYTLLELRGQPCGKLNTEFLYTRKGILSSRSFGKPVISKNELKEAIATYTSRACYKLRKQNSIASTLTVFIRTSRFKDRYYSNSYTIELENPTAFTPQFINAAYKGFDKIYKPHYPYKKAGVFLRGIRPSHKQQKSLFENKAEKDKQKRLMKTLDALTKEFGTKHIYLAAEGHKKKWQMKSENRSPAYTNKWDELPVVH